MEAVRSDKDQQWKVSNLLHPVAEDILTSTGNEALHVHFEEACYPTYFHIENVFYICKIYLPAAMLMLV